MNEKVSNWFKIEKNDTDSYNVFIIRIIIDC